MLLPVSGVTTLDVADEFSGPPSAVGVGQLERPESGRGLLEVGAAGGDLVNEVLNAWRQFCSVPGRGSNAQMMPNLPSCFSMMALSVMGSRWPSTLAYPRL